MVLQSMTCRDPIRESTPVEPIKCLRLFREPKPRLFATMSCVSFDCFHLRKQNINFLQTLSDAPIFNNKRHIFYGYYYGTAELKCEVLADPPARIKWVSKPVPQEYFTVHNDSINSSILEVRGQGNTSSGCVNNF